MPATSPLARMGNPKGVRSGGGLQLVPPLGYNSRFANGRLLPFIDRVDRPKELARAAGLPLGLEVPDPKWFYGTIHAHLTMTDNSTTSWDLTAGVWDQRFENLYGTGADPECMLHVVGAQVFVVGGELEVSSVRREFMEKLFITAIRSTSTQKEPLFGGVHFLSRVTVDSDQATASVDTRPAGGWQLFTPFNIDMKQDQLTLNLDSAINSGADINFTLRLLCCGWPNTVNVGAQSCGGAVITAGPTEFCAAVDQFVAQNPFYFNGFAGARQAA